MFREAGRLNLFPRNGTQSPNKLDNGILKSMSAQTSYLQLVEQRTPDR